jgi:hypothetical protein
MSCSALASFRGAASDVHVALAAPAQMLCESFAGWVNSTRVGSIESVMREITF